MEFDEFYQENYTRIYRTMLLTFRNPSLSEEITQEAFYRALRRWGKVSRLVRPDAWTMVVALNVGRDIARRRKQHEGRTSLLVEEETNREGQVDDRMAIVVLLNAVSPRQREVLVLRYIAQMSVTEIAKSMRCAEGTVKATLHAALERAAQVMKGSSYAED
jgi:RNA polymerase sigma factor (sigma-70 family)